MSDSQGYSPRGWVTAALIGVIAFLACLPIFFNLSDPNSEDFFAGADGVAQNAVSEVNPDYVPWIEPLIGDLPSEIESGIFALQAGLGAGVVAYVLGYYHGRTKERRAHSAGVVAGTDAAADAT